MQPAVGVDADQMGIECRMMNLRERDAVRNHWLAEQFVLVRDDVRRVEQQRIGQFPSAPCTQRGVMVN
jgi:hypothetical protein